MTNKIKMHKFGQFIYVDGRKCRVCKVSDETDCGCDHCDYAIAGGLECGHPVGPAHCLATVPYEGYLKKL